MKGLNVKSQLKFLCFPLLSRRIAIINVAITDDYATRPLLQYEIALKFHLSEIARQRPAKIVFLNGKKSSLG